jgi:hypothetical protein
MEPRCCTRIGRARGSEEIVDLCLSFRNRALVVEADMERQRLITVNTQDLTKFPPALRICAGHIEMD